MTRASAARFGRCTVAVSITRRNTRAAPQELPERLHWFKWEAYTTWLSGMFLTALVYWYGAEVYLIDPVGCRAVRPGGGSIAIAFIVGGWLVYDLLCKSPLARDTRVFAASCCCCSGYLPGACASCSVAVAPISTSAQCWARSWWPTCSSSSFPGRRKWWPRPSAASAGPGSRNPRPSSAPCTTRISRCPCCSS